ncbi:MAG: arsenic efflux protein [Bacteroidetes bacterium]|nr:arsenic efflux protein [Bacteroidota bacterium]
MGVILQEVLVETFQITFLVLLMMIVVDLINLWSRGRVALFLKHRQQWRQYVLSSFLGSIPGCVGGFTNVSLYIHGMISFGALVGSMVATSGDEAFVMLALFPKTAILLIGILFILGILLGWIVDRFVRRFGISTCADCREVLIHTHEYGVTHYIKEHIWQHIIRQHLVKTVLWTFAALLVVKVGIDTWNLDDLSSQYTLIVLFLSALIGIIPESGPHLLFVTLFANGAIPFSVLITSCIVQDGHSMLPMLSYSVRDSLLVKAFNVVFGLIIGLILYSVGL